MAGKINPTTLRWRHDGKNTDESAFDPQKFGRWEVELNGSVVKPLAIAWEADGEYEAPIASLQLAEGAYIARMRLVRADGTPSEWSESVEFEIRKVPRAPFDVVVE